MNKNENNNLLPFRKIYGALTRNSGDMAKNDVDLQHSFELKQHCFGVRSVSVTSDNRYLIITFENTSRIRVVDLEKLEYLPINYEGHTNSVRLTSITDDNKAFYTASWDGTARRFEIATGECTQIFSGFGRSPSCFVDSEQKYLFTASYDSDYDLDSQNTGRCWDISTGRSITKYKHTNERCALESIDIAYHKGRVYTGSDDGHAYMWHLFGEEQRIQYFSFKGSIRKVAVSANFFAAACTDGMVRVCNKFSGEYYASFLHDESDIREVRISKDETKIWSAAADGSISCYNLMTRKLIYHQKPHSSWIWSMCLMNNDKVLVTGSGDGSIVFSSANSGQILAQLLNLPLDNEFLIVCPPDKTFQKGFFYTTNKDYVQVEKGDKNTCTNEKLDMNDSRREAYINKLNLKNLIITRLKNNEQYNSLTKQFVQNQKMLKQVNYQKTLQLLKA